MEKTRTGFVLQKGVDDMKRFRNWIGKPFRKWCEDAHEDERRIKYQVNGKIDGKNQLIKFTSDDEVDLLWIFRLRSEKCIITDLRLHANEWIVNLQYNPL